MPAAYLSVDPQFWADFKSVGHSELFQVTLLGTLTEPGSSYIIVKVESPTIPSLLSGKFVKATIEKTLDLQEGQMGFVRKIVSTPDGAEASLWYKISWSDSEEVDGKKRLLGFVKELV